MNTPDQPDIRAELAHIQAQLTITQTKLNQVMAEYHALRELTASLLPIIPKSKRTAAQLTTMLAFDAMQDSWPAGCDDEFQRIANAAFDDLQRCLYDAPLRDDDPPPGDGSQPSAGCADDNAPPETP